MAFSRCPATPAASVPRMALSRRSDAAGGPRKCAGLGPDWLDWQVVSGKKVVSSGLYCWCLIFYHVLIALDFLMIDWSNLTFLSSISQCYWSSWSAALLSSTQNGVIIAVVCWKKTIYCQFDDSPIARGYRQGPLFFMGGCIEPSTVGQWERTRNPASQYMNRIPDLMQEFPHESK